MKSWKLLTLVGVFAWAWTAAATARPAKYSKKIAETGKTVIPVTWLDDQPTPQRYLQ